MTPSVPSLRKTPLTEWHRAHGATLAPRAGWEMPVEFSNVASEYGAVRTRAGVSDSSDLGEIELAGNDALAALQRMASNDAAALAVGESQRTVLTTTAGTIVDEVLVCRLGKAHFLFVTSVASAGRVAAWMREQASGFGDVAVVDTSSRYALIALEGPAAAEALQDLTGADLAGHAAGTFTYGEVSGVRTLLARAGRTGEDGFQLFVAPQMALRVWEALLRTGDEGGVVPVGTAAREVLRLEAGYLLHGQDTDGTTTLIEAGLEPLIAWGKGEFNGREVLAAQKSTGTSRILVGFELEEPGALSHGDVVRGGPDTVGVVTSGGTVPPSGKAIGLARVTPSHSAPGTGLEVEVRGRPTRARVVPLPFYTRSKG